MGKNKDLIIILAIILVGMFIPFFGSIVINYGLDAYKILSTFGYFLLIFAIELLLVYLYFTISNKIANKKIKKFKHK